MNKDLIIEHYLSQLDRELQALPTGARAEIITEIRSHILDSSEKNPDRGVQSLLDDMGTPKDVAIRYLQQKGVKYWAPSKSRSWLKILGLTVGGLFAVAVLAVVLTIWYFSPLIRVDESKGRVTLFGGLIDVNDQANEVKIGSLKIKDHDKVKNGGRGTIEVTEDGDGSHDFQLHLNGAGISKSRGEEDLAAKKVRAVKIPFNTAKLEVLAGAGQILKWKCKNLSTEVPKVSVAAGVLTMDLNKVGPAKCEVRLPEGVKTEIKGINGDLELHKPASPLDIAVTNGKIGIHPDQSRVYDFEVRVANGMQDSFARSTDKSALKIKVDVENGLVQRDSDDEGSNDEDED